MSKKLVAVSLLAISLAACGNPKKSPDDASNDRERTSNYLSNESFAKICTAQPDGFLLNADVCLIAHTSHLEKGVRGTIPVRDVAAGNFIVSDGTAGAVQILLNGTTLAGIHGTRIVIPASGKLALRVLLETQSESSLVVYECYDRFTDDGKNMRSIACRPELIP